MNIESRDKFIEDHFDHAMRLVRVVAGRNEGLREDLEDVAIDALVAAASSYDDTRGAKFWTYCEMKTRYAFADYFASKCKEVSCAEVFVDCENPYQELYDSETDELIRVVLDRLGISHPDAIQAVYGMLSFKELAITIDTRYEVVRRRIIQCRKIVHASLYPASSKREVENAENKSVYSGCIT